MTERRHDTFKYHVFASQQEVSSKEEMESGVYLVEETDALCPSNYFHLFYQSAGMGITSYEDVTIAGTMLERLADMISRVLSDLSGSHSFALSPA